MRLHHLALSSPDPQRLATWYGELLQVATIRTHGDDTGLRSVWVDIGGVILMIERGIRRGWDGVFFAAEAGSGEEWARRFTDAGSPPTGRTEFTLYAMDPEGNRIGVSSWPEPLG